MAKSKIVIGNWKMNPLTAPEAEKWFKSAVLVGRNIKKTEVVVCAPFVYLERLSKIRTGKIKLGGQDAYPGEIGAFTGEVSSEMLYNLGIRHVILGHSERRTIGETDAVVNRKLKGALASGLTPILCVGESARDLNHGYFNVVRTQLEECLRGIPKNSVSKIIVAYEPVWALSSTENRRDATAADSKEMTMFIRKVLSELASPEVAKATRIIYGGSVSERDAGEFLTAGGVDGVLPGKASMDPKKFSEIIRIADKIK